MRIRIPCAGVTKIPCKRQRAEGMQSQQALSEVENCNVHTQCKQRWDPQPSQEWAGSSHCAPGQFSSGCSATVEKAKQDDDRRVTMWNPTERRKISGNAAPFSRNLVNYLELHPEWEVYTDQLADKKKRKRPPSAVGLQVDSKSYTKLCTKMLILKRQELLCQYQGECERSADRNLAALPPGRLKMPLPALPPGQTAMTSHVLTRPEPLPAAASSGEDRCKLSEENPDFPCSPPTLDAAVAAVASASAFHQPQAHHMARAALHSAAERVLQNVVQAGGILAHNLLAP